MTSIGVCRFGAVVAAAGRFSFVSSVHTKHCLISFIPTFTRRPITRSVYTENDFHTIPSSKHPLVASASTAASTNECVGLTSGQPEEYIHRKCVIYKPARPATQQSTPEPKWRIAFDVSAKWINPLMGWTTVNDSAPQVHRQMSFDSCEQAVEFCKREGFQYEVAAVHEKKRRKKAYADNFKWEKAKEVPIEEQAAQTPEQKNNVS